MAHTENDGRGPLPKGGEVKRKDREHGVHDNWPSELVPHETGRLMEWLVKYAEDMHVWGQRVRMDIRALEEHTGLGHGDPGDPPAGPW